MPKAKRARKRSSEGEIERYSYWAFTDLSKATPVAKYNVALKTVPNGAPCWLFTDSYGRLYIIIAADNVGLFKTTDFTETRDITRWGGTTLTGRDITGDIAKLSDLANALGSVGADVFQIGKGADIVETSGGLYKRSLNICDTHAPFTATASGRGAKVTSAYSWLLWRDFPAEPYVVTETTYTRKTYFRIDVPQKPHFLGGSQAIRGYVSAAGEKMYVRARSSIWGTIGTVSFTETTPTTKWIPFTLPQSPAVFHEIYYEAYVAAAGQTGYITEVAFHVHSNLPIIWGWTYSLGTRQQRPIRVDFDGYIQNYPYGSEGQKLAQDTLEPYPLLVKTVASKPAIIMTEKTGKRIAKLLSSIEKELKKLNSLLSKKPT